MMYPILFYPILSYSITAYSYHKSWMMSIWEEKRGVCNGHALSWTHDLCRGWALMRLEAWWQQRQSLALDRIPSDPWNGWDRDMPTAWLALRPMWWSEWIKHSTAQRTFLLNPHEVPQGSGMKQSTMNTVELWSAVRHTNASGLDWTVL